MADMIVSGAGTSAANGTYVENGTYGDYPQYVKSDGNLIRMMNTSWYIGGSNLTFDPDYGPQGTVYYKANSYAATPDLVSTWLVTLHGTLPVPTVTASGGSAGIPKQYLHYARLRGN